MFDELPDPIEYVGGPKDGMITFTPANEEQTRNGSRGGKPVFYTYVRCADRMIFLGWLEWGVPALTDALRRYHRGVRRG